MSGRTLVALVAGAALAAPAVASAPARPVAFLESAQNADGGYGSSKGSASTPLFTAWAAMGLAATDRPASARLRSRLRLDASRVDSTGDAERTILALRAAGERIPTALVSRVLGAQRADGSIDGLANLTSFGILALRAAGRPTTSSAVRRAATALVAAPRGRGVDDAAATLQALVAAGRSRDDATVTDLAASIARSQNPDGGFPAGPGGRSNAQSTAFAVQGLVAAGRDPERVRTAGSRSPLGYLRTLIASDGSVRYSRSGTQTPVWVTSQALLAFARDPFPIEPPKR